MKTFLLFTIWLISIVFLSLWLNAKGEDGQLTFVMIGVFTSTLTSALLFKHNQKRGDKFTYFNQKSNNKL